MTDGRDASACRRHGVEPAESGRRNSLKGFKNPGKMIAITKAGFLNNLLDGPIGKLKHEAGFFDTFPAGVFLQRIAHVFLEEATESRDAHPCLSGENGIAAPGVEVIIEITDEIENPGVSTEGDRHFQLNPRQGQGNQGPCGEGKFPFGPIFRRNHGSQFTGQGQQRSAHGEADNAGSGFNEEFGHPEVYKQMLDAACVPGGKNGIGRKKNHRGRFHLRGEGTGPNPGSRTRIPIQAPTRQ